MKAGAALVRQLAAPVEVEGEQFILAMGNFLGGVPETGVTMLRGLVRFLGRAGALHTPENAPPPIAGSAYHQPPPSLGSVPDDVVYPPGHYQGD